MRGRPGGKAVNRPAWAFLSEVEARKYEKWREIIVCEPRTCLDAMEERCRG